MEVLVFRTSLRNQQNISRAGLHLKELPGIISWNVDLHDVDNVLRIESSGISPRIVETTLSGAGYFCEELPD